MTPEREKLTVRSRYGVVAQEEELLDLLDEFQRTGSEQVARQRSTEAPVNNGRHPRKERSRHDP